MVNGLHLYSPFLTGGHKRNFTLHVTCKILYIILYILSNYYITFNHSYSYSHTDGGVNRAS